jgi:hypothetical protein
VEGAPEEPAEPSEPAEPAEPLELYESVVVIFTLSNCFGLPAKPHSGHRLTVETLLLNSLLKIPNIRLFFYTFFLFKKQKNKYNF